MAGYNDLTDQDLDKRIAALRGELGGGGDAAAAPKPAAAASYGSMSDDDLDKALAAARRDAEAPTLQEMHPAFGDADRLIAKNFAANDEAAVAFLRKRHPHLDVELGEGGQIRARAKDGSESDYRVLDPDQGLVDSFTSLAGAKEGLRDLGDLGYDAVSGIGTGAATAAAGLAAGLGSFGLGALPAAAAAGAGSSVAFEGARQGIGKLLGIDDNFDGTNLAVAGITGGASPFLFGTGGKAAAAAVQQAQRGLVGRGVDAYVKPQLAKLGATASGASQRAIETLGRNYGTIQRLERDPEAITNFTKQAGQAVGEKLREAKAPLWDTVEAARAAATDAGEMVDVTAAAAPLEAAVQRAKTIADTTKTEASQELYQQLKGELNRLFTYTEQVPAVGDTGPVLETIRRKLTEVTPDAAANLAEHLGEMGKVQNLKADRIGVGNRLAATATAADKRTAALGLEMQRALSSSLDEVLSPEAAAARQAYGELANLQKRAAPLLRNPTKAFQSLRNADRMPNAVNAELFGRLDRQLGTDLLERSNVLDAYATFGKAPSAVPLSTGGATSTTRTLENFVRQGKAATVGGALGYWLGSSQGGEGRGSGVLGGLLGGALAGKAASPAAIRKIIAAGIKGGQLNQGLGALRPGVGSLLLRPAVSPWMGVGEQQP